MPGLFKAHNGQQRSIIIVPSGDSDGIWKIMVRKNKKEIDAVLKQEKKEFYNSFE